MRKRFEVQYELGATRIEDVSIPQNSRDELPPVLQALQYLFCDLELSAQVYEALEKCINAKVRNPRTGCLGMSYWEVLVLAVVRLTLDCDYDRLEHTANYDKLVRLLLGVEVFGGDLKRYPLQTIKDNVGLLDEATLIEINKIVVKAGHSLVKKKRKN